MDVLGRLNPDAPGLLLAIALRMPERLVEAFEQRARTHQKIAFLGVEEVGD